LWHLISIPDRWAEGYLYPLFYFTNKFTEITLFSITHLYVCTSIYILHRLNVSGPNVLGQNVSPKRISDKTYRGQKNRRQNVSLTKKYRDRMYRKTKHIRTKRIGGQNVSVDKISTSAKNRIVQRHLQGQSHEARWTNSFIAGKLSVLMR
jgi:hypothetical protein